MVGRHRLPEFGVGVERVADRGTDDPRLRCGNVGGGDVVDLVGRRGDGAAVLPVHGVMLSHFL
ncbi:MAG: hypothetical protein AVDCRST_MAG59-1054 [uncultured Thermomicrobiales bacterium]|uniref:Uncharacterized protein n=1 Tax=uncultured Thermomicrobiales bacterium TaxID=1645740 RepID=A0A6J4U8P6_9BACT|nr:MAG: hypothetical protein AVDCRST_MAG59-1054 [uncultured Thermomicrobiales bacterium]